MEIVIRELKKVYGQQTVLDIPYLEIHEGLTAIVGPNGAGKSTLLKCTAGLLPFDGGEIRYDKSLKAPVRDMTLVFQEPYMLNTTAERNIAYPLKLRKAEREQIDRRVKMLAEELKLTRLLKKKATRLSLGEAQKVALARALSFDPKVLLLDEPCASIDPHTTGEIEQLLLGLKKQGTIILMVTHNLAQAKRLADRVILLASGNVIASDGAKAFFEAPSDEKVKKFIEGELLI